MSLGDGCGALPYLIPALDGEGPVQTTHYVQDLDGLLLQEVMTSPQALMVNRPKNRPGLETPSATPTKRI